jgi:hypothetical protein
MGNDHQAQLLRGACSQSASLFHSSEHAVEGNVLAEEKDFVLSPEVVVEVARREVGGRGNITHTGFGEAAYAKLFSGGAQDFQTPRKVAALNTALVPASDPFAWQPDSLRRAPPTFLKLRGGRKPVKEIRTRVQIMNNSSVCQENFSRWPNRRVIRRIDEGGSRI